MMLFHLSIEADRPQHVAGILAEFLGGCAMPFPSVGTGSWVALAGDARSTLIEVYPRGTELHPGEGNADAVGLAGAPRRFHATHFAMATALDLETVLAMVRREGWPAKLCHRGGAFHVIEIWIENSQMIELLTPDMQQEYLGTVTIPNWRRMIEDGVMPETMSDVAPS